MVEEGRHLLKNRYRLDEVVGEGGMAVVWRAHDTELDRTVAVKVLREQYASDPEFLARFRSEARSAAALNDPGVVSVHDVGDDEGRHFLVMEYVPGRDLKSLIRDEAPLSAERAVAVAASLSRAVAAAHEMGMVHRDIKPQNVLVCPDGQMKVADFGIARAVTAGGMTEPGLVMGTVHYIAPEQAAGDSATPASDVYSLGVVLYEMLTGSVPFDADSSVGVAMKIMNEDPTPVEVRNPRVPTVLAGIVARAMARDPDERYLDAGALADALTGFASWSEQATGGFRATSEDAAPRSGFESPDAGAAAAPPMSATARDRAVVPDADGPLIDRTGLLLAVIALIALAGLVPLWLAVLTRADASPFGGPPDAGDGSGSPTIVTDTPSSQSAIGPTPEPVEVPDLVGLSVEEATERLAEDDLGATTPSEASSVVPPGHVIRQAPNAGELLPPGGIVELVVSREPGIELPSLTGDYETVAAAILSLGLEPVRRPVWSGSSSELGAVIGLDPPPGSRVPRGSAVHVTVNAGPWLSLGVDYEDNIHLRAVELPVDSVPPGGELTFVALWETVGEVNGDYAARATLRASDGGVVSRAELPLADRPANSWQPGERVSSGRFVLSVGADVAPGDYGLWFELYPKDRPEGQLAVRSRGLASRLSEGSVRIREIEVQAQEQE